MPEPEEHFRAIVDCLVVDFPDFEDFAARPQYPAAFSNAPSSSRKLAVNLVMRSSDSSHRKTISFSSKNGS
jgi:hypothetical protein